MNPRVNVMRMFYWGSGLYTGVAIDAAFNGPWWKALLHFGIAAVWFLLGWKSERSALYGYMWKCDHNWKPARGIPDAEECECGAVRFKEEH